MTISNGTNTKNLTLYSLAQPLLQDEQVVWLNMGDPKMYLDSIKQLMMISRESFVSIKEEDEVISSIILNEYGTQTKTSSTHDRVLESILPLPSQFHYFEPVHLPHSLFPHEIDSSPIAHILMVEKVVKTTIAPRKELNLSKSLSQEQHHDVL